MKNLEKIKLKYNHPATPKDGIKLKTIYSIGEDSEGYFIFNKDLKLYMNIERMKSIFVIENDFKWEDILDNKKSVEIRETKDISEKDTHELENLKHFQKNMSKRYKKEKKSNNNSEE